jgi:hypothetical protein
MQGIEREIGGGNAGGSRAHEKAEADLLALGALHVLQLPQAHLHAGRSVAYVKNVGGVGPCFSGGFDK